MVNYPSPELRDELNRVSYCFITHEHPDHFHTASIRSLPRSIQYLVPDLPEEHMAGYLSSHGHAASVVTPFEWRVLRAGVRILSIPLLNDDSVLLVETPAAIIVNLNDSKPQRGQMQRLRAWLDAHAAGKRRVLLSSYSPASIVNSFMRHGRRVSLRQKADYVRYICDHCRLLGIDDFMPFASQVIFRRRDSHWANAFKVTFADLQEHWDAPRTRLLPPYSRLDLATGGVTSVPPECYRQSEVEARQKVDAQESLDQLSELDDASVEQLRTKLNGSRWLLAALFPRGVGFDLERTQLRYNPWTGRLERGTSRGDFTLHVPPQAFKDAVSFGHLGDMGTTMFTLVMLNSGIDPRRVYLFFLIISLHDYGHTAGLRGWLRWLRGVWRVQVWRIPPGSSELGAAG